MLYDRKICCLQARPGICQPGKFTGWGSQGVNSHSVHWSGVMEKDWGDHLRFVGEVWVKGGEEGGGLGGHGEVDFVLV